MDPEAMVVPTPPLSRQKPVAPTPSPLIRTVPPMARPAPKAQVAAAPPQAASKSRLKRIQPHQGHAEAILAPSKMPNVVTPVLPSHINDEDRPISAGNYLKALLNGAPILGQAQQNSAERRVQVPVAPNFPRMPMILPGQVSGPETRQVIVEPPSNGVQSTKSVAVRKRGEHLATREQAEAAPEVIEHSAPQAPVPVSQGFRPIAMPGLITPQSLYNGSPRAPMEQVTGQIERGLAQAPMNLEANANFQQPILVNVIWKRKMVTVPECVRCEKCQGLMDILFDVRNPRRRRNPIFPTYRCYGCGDIRSFGGKFDRNEAVAEAAWPRGKFNSKEAAPLRNLDLDRTIAEAIRRVTEKTEKIHQKRAQLNVCRSRQHHLSEDFHCGCAATGASGDVTTSDPKVAVAQDAVNPRMPALGNLSSYSFHKLVQKVLVVAGRIESEDAELDEAVLKAVSAEEFLNNFETLLASENGEAE